MDLARTRIDPADFAVNEARVGVVGEANQVDVALVEVVVTGNKAGKHAGIGGIQFFSDDDDTEAMLALHRKREQHADMGMPAANQHQAAVSALVCARAQVVGPLFAT